MCNRNICGIILTVAVVLELPAVTRGQLTGQQAQRISNAMPQKARVAPKEPRRVLIWNTPFMDKCPHKGYCVPQAGYAMKLLGERTGAFEPLVSDDVAMYLPENLKRFDAIIFNNSNGPWIRPTEKPGLLLRDWPPHGHLVESKDIAFLSGRHSVRHRRSRCRCDGEHQIRRRARIHESFQRQRPDGLEGQSENMVRERRCHHRTDHAEESCFGEYLPDLDRR